MQTKERAHLKAKKMVEHVAFPQQILDTESMNQLYQAQNQNLSH
jgi:hypothetical protein